jgi:hypothetical protein
MARGCRRSSMRPRRPAAVDNVTKPLGEAYVIQGKLDPATSQLATIKTICGTGWNTEDLAKL